MRDDRTRWAAPDGAEDRRLEARGLSIRRVVPERQMIVSGPRPAALQLCGFRVAAGWPDIVLEDRYAVSMRRDRVLLVNAPQLATGWLDDSGLAVSDVTDGYEVVDVSGPDALEFLRTGTELSLDDASASSLRLWHGLGVILYRVGDPDRYRLHVASGLAEGLWDILAAQLSVFEP